jgi:hypothetical protein
MMHLMQDSNFKKTLKKLKPNRLQAHNQSKSDAFKSWNSIYLGSQTVITFLALFHAWMLQYKTLNGNATLIERVSFKVDDLPWTPPGFEAKPIYYFHYFGDWFLNVAYARIQAPYEPSLLIPAPTPPFGLLLTRLISLFGIGSSYALITALTIIVWVVIIQNYLRDFTQLNRIYIAFFLVFITAPTVVAFDRGALHLLCTGLVGCAMISYEKRKNKTALFLIILAISFKPYLILLSFWLLRKKEYRKMGYIFFSCISINFLALFAYYSNPFDGLLQYFNGIKFFSGSFMVSQSLNSASFVGFAYRVFVFIFGSDSQYISNLLPLYYFYGLIVIIYGGFIVYVIRNRKVPNFIAVIFLLSIFSLATPAAMEYSLVWTSLAAIYTLHEFETKTTDQRILVDRNIGQLRRIYFVSSALFIVVLTPFFGMIATPHNEILVNINTILYVPILLVLAVLVVIKYGKNTHRANFPLEN